MPIPIPIVTKVCFGQIQNTHARNLLGCWNIRWSVKIKMRFMQYGFHLLIDRPLFIIYFKAGAILVHHVLPNVPLIGESESNEFLLPLTLMFATSFTFIVLALSLFIGWLGRLHWLWFCWIVSCVIWRCLCNWVLWYWCFCSTA